MQDRIRSYMDRAKNIQDLAKAPKIDKAASKRFVKSALWKAAQKQASEADKQGETTPSTDKTEGIQNSFKNYIYLFCHESCITFEFSKIHGMVAFNY